MVALSLADLLTALTTEPFFAAYYFIIYFQEDEEVSSVLKTLVDAGQLISTIAINFSFLVILALSWSRRHSWPENIASDITSLNFIDRCKPKTRRDNLLKQFTVVVIYLAVILLLAALPHIIIAQIYLYSSDLSPQAVRNLRIALLVSDLLLFLKMCLDSFVYVWRLSSYRRAIKILFFCRGEK